MKICCFSAGVSSAMAAYLARGVDHVFYIHIEEQHPDSLRFLHDVEKLLGREIEIMQSPYKSVENVIRQTRFIKSAFGAACTGRLKRQVRKEWEQKQNEPLIYVWGFDVGERDRAQRLIEAMPLQTHEFPLIEAGLDKEQVHGLARRLGLKRPIPYDQGFPNNNCLPCVKMGMGSFNLVRKLYPEAFDRMARLEREIGHSCLKECFLDELAPDRGNPNTEILEECGIMCQLAWVDSGILKEGE